MKPVRNLLLPCLFFACVCLSATAKAQHSYTIQVKDSLQANDSSQWLSNDIHLQNTRSEIIRLQLTVSLPPKWQVVGRNILDVVLQPGESRIVPLNLIKAVTALAKWQKAEILIEEAGSTNRATVPFYLRANPVSVFEMDAPVTELFVKDDTRLLVLEAIFRNTGNVDQQLVFEARNEFFELKETVTRTLEPGEEYKFVNKLRITSAVRKTLLKENIRVSARNKTQKMQSALFVINNLSTNAAQHKSPYRGIPVQLETGLMYFGNNFNYYVGMQGAIQLRDSQQVSFSYRSKQLGVANTVERNAFSLEYQNRNWKLYAGQLSSTKSFFTFGQGISATYKGANEHEVNVTGIIHYRNSPYTNDLYSVSMRNKIKNTILQSGIEVNSQKADDRYAYVLTNEAQLIRRDNITLSTWVNIGQTHFMYKPARKELEKLGLVFGYSFSYNLGNAQFGSDLQNATGPYPGINGGISNQNHRISFKVRKNINLDVYYRYNKSNRSSLLFIDTVFNTNFFDYNLEQYGARARIVAGKNMDFTLGGGKYTQQGSFDRNLLNDAGFFEFASSYRKGRNASLRFSSTVGFGAVNVGSKKKNIVIGRSNLSGNYKFIGFTAFYYRTPRIPNTGFVADTINTVTETMSFTPYVNIKMSRTFSGNVSYSFAKSLYDQSVSTFAGLNLLYSNKRNGLYATLTGNVPISNTTEKFSSLANNSVILSIRKDLNIPNIIKRKYYNLDIILFKDDNLNLRRDEGELGVSDVTVNIVSQRMFITNAEGKITFRNVEQKYYVIDLATVKAPRGYIPPGGYLHYADVKKNTTLEIPYQRGKVISGNVKVVLDSLSSTQRKFASDKIKVMAIDSLGNPYKGMTDKNGDYYINVPPGKYKVTLNPDAYSKDLKPVQLFFFVTFEGTRDEEIVNFEIRERKREIRYLKQ